jgi:hypothetical protein
MKEQIITSLILRIHNSLRTLIHTAKNMAARIIIKITNSMKSSIIYHSVKSTLLTILHLSKNQTSSIRPTNNTLEHQPLTSPIINTNNNALIIKNKATNMLLTMRN